MSMGPPMILLGGIIPRKYHRRAADRFNVFRALVCVFTSLDIHVYLITTQILFVILELRAVTLLVLLQRSLVEGMNIIGAGKHPEDRPRFL